MGAKPRPRPLITGADGVARCYWCGDSPDYVAYHDREWGFPVSDDRRLFEKICLEGFQSGLSWLTILRKRARFREVFAGFDPTVVARFGDRDVDRLLGDPGIIRHRQKIESVINNARRALELVDERGSLAAYVWSFEPATASRPLRLTTSDESHALSRDLRSRGWTFVGPTTAYAFMQAVGLVDDHFEGCAVRPAVEHARQAFTRPS